MSGSPAMKKKRCRDDEPPKTQESVIEAASALAVLSKSPSAASPNTSGSDDDGGESESSASDSEGDEEETNKPAPSAVAPATKGKSAMSFPEKLMDILTILESESSSDGTMADQPISWLPGGDGFLISDPNEFTLKVLPRFFSQRVEFSSFTRKLYWWGFRKVTRGAGTDAFHHDFFLKADPSLCRKIKGKPRRKPGKNLSKQAIAKSKSSDTGTMRNLTQAQSLAVSSLPSAGTPISINAALPVYKNIAFGAVSNPIGQANTAAANLLLNTSSPLIAAAALGLQQQQRQQQQGNAQTAAAQAIQQLVLNNNASVSNQALALAAAANVQQRQLPLQYQQPTQQLNIAGCLAGLQRGGPASLAQSGISAVSLLNPSTQQQLPGIPAPATPAPSIQLPTAAAATVAAAPAASSAASPALAPGSQIVIHVHHMPDGSVRFSQSNVPNANGAPG